jgi:hypothetical protein
MRQLPRKEAKMANRLKMATVQSILTLHERGWSQRRIATELDVNRETVSRYVRLARQSDPADQANPAIAPIDPAGLSAFSNPAIAPIGSSPGRHSNCQPWRTIIEAKQAQGLSVRRIYQDLVSEHAAAVSYDSVRRFLKRLGWVRPLPFRRVERAPGEEAQIDFGSGADPRLVLIRRLTTWVQQEFASGIMLNGEWQTKPRDDLKQMVRTGELRLLLGTDSASEGLNLQRLALNELVPIEDFAVREGGVVGAHSLSGFQSRLRRELLGHRLPAPLNGIRL